MTSEITQDELREACLASGLQVDAVHAFPRMWYAHDGNTTWMDDDPALPAYIASRLVAMVASDENLHPVYEIYLSGIDILATDAERIRAAMEVLKDG